MSCGALVTGLGGGVGVGITTACWSCGGAGWFTGFVLRAVRWAWAACWLWHSAFWFCKVRMLLLAAFGVPGAGLEATDCLEDARLGVVSVWDAARRWSWRLAGMAGTGMGNASRPGCSWAGWIAGPTCCSCSSSWGLVCMALLLDSFACDCQLPGSCLGTDSLRGAPCLAAGWWCCCRSSAVGRGALPTYT